MVSLSWLDAPRHAGSHGSPALENNPKDSRGPPFLYPVQHPVVIRTHLPRGIGELFDGFAQRLALPGLHFCLEAKTLDGAQDSLPAEHRNLCNFRPGFVRPLQIVGGLRTATWAHTELSVQCYRSFGGQVPGALLASQPAVDFDIFPACSSLSFPVSAARRPRRESKAWSRERRRRGCRPCCVSSNA